MTKIDIISGFLGAGKTTLIKKLLDECFQGQKLVLIENEFGEISIDGGFLKDAGVQINEISSGCICCSLVGQFDEALHQVVEEYHPDRVIIEPSGVGKLSDVSRAVGNAGQTTPMELGCAVAVVDPKRFKVYMKNFGEFYTDQIETAGTIVLSRTQDLAEEKLAEIVAKIREMNAEATIITTPWDQISGDTILAAMNHHSLADELMNEAREAAERLDEEECDDPECSCHDHHHHHHHHEHDPDDHDHEEHEHHHHHHGHDADEVFISWGVETPKKFSAAELEEILAKLDTGDYGLVLRAKGIVPSADGKWLQFDMVPEEHEVREGTADYTGRLCVIGSELKEEALPGLFGL
ncbi:MAG: GTP-binding protein [Lachnospiraceae bacterium]|nr:GTP-binding protein [Lachnospiraceae bacterium]